MDKPTTSNSPSRWWDLPAAVLLLIILTAAFTRLVATQWTDQLDITRTLAYLGLISGLALGQSRFSVRLAGFLAIVYGLFAVPWRLGEMMPEGILWSERLLSLAGRLGVILTQLAKRQAVSDNLLFLVLMAALFWTLSVHAGYSLTRYASPWRVILPTGISMVLIHSYDAYIPRRIWYLVIYLFFSLILVTRLVFLQNRQRWQKSNTYIPPYLGVDFVRIALGITFVLLALSWTTPVLADTLPAAQDIWQRIKEPWNEVRNTLDNAFASLRSTVGIVSDYYGPSMILGRGNRLADTVVFNVSVPPEPPAGFRYYWRARVYDSYQYSGWSSTMVTTSVIDPDDFDLELPDLRDNAPGQYPFAITVYAPLATLLSVNQPIWSSRPVKVEYSENPDGTWDLASIRANPALRAGETYNIRSSLNAVTVASLREAGDEYPDWVKERYLQLPDSITARTLILAEQIAAGKTTPYDVVIAVTNYLRDNIQYTETVPNPPGNQEAVDWFLFDLQQGFCNYYATAEIILLRAVGIPARMSVGYAQGEPIEGTDGYTVRQRDAHAWPEVYFPGIGWVEFEPTVSQPILNRPFGANTTSSSSSPVNPPDEDLEPFESPRLRQLEEEENAQGISPVATLGYGGLILGLLIALVVLATPFIRRKRLQERLSSIPIALEIGFRKLGLQPPKLLLHWAKLARLSPLGRAYQQINSALARLGIKPELNNTPAERVHELIKILPLAERPAHQLLAEYQLATYSHHATPDVDLASTAGKEIRTLSIKALIQRLFTRIEERVDGRYTTPR